MKTILISLVSEQTIPNVLLIKEFNELVTDYVFITTEKMEGENRTECIIKAARLDSAKAQKILVNQNSLEDIERELKGKLPDAGEDNTYIVNLTGGNKLMFLAAYNFVTKYKNCAVYYFPVQDKMTSYERIWPEKDDHELNCKVTLQEYLDAYGVKPTSSKFNKLIKTPEETQTFFKHYLSLVSDDLGVIDELRKSYRGKKITLSALQVDKKLKELEALLNRLGFTPKSKGKLNEDETKYLTGDWFEEYFYHQLKQHFYFDEDVIGTGIHVGFDENEKDTSNECDVLFVRNNRLHLVECKTSIYDEETQRSLFSETAYKAAALRKKFGLNVKSIICTLSTRSEKSKDTVRDLDVKRAKVFEIEYILDRDIVADSYQLAQKLNAL